jgi:phosphoribosylamine---glycine ligase
VKVLVIGSGGREHALVRALNRDPQVSELVCAPGNAGIATEARTHPVDVADAQAVADLADDVDADLVVIGPELPLVNGAADEIRARGRLCFGPDQAAAELEGSKSFAKEVMSAAGVPTAAAITARTLDEAEEAFDRFGAPYVVKADGLAAGKGVVVTDDIDVAGNHAAECLATEAGRVVIEEYLDGPEVSLFVLCDGTTAVPLQPAQDFKRAYDNDAGPNTGGMGAYTPLPWAPTDLPEEVVRSVAQPVLAEMAARGTPFVGLLYVGLALTSRGLRVVEFNVRFGDPETQAVLELLETPLAGVLQAAAMGSLSDLEPLQWRDDAAVIVVLASSGYPASARTGDTITGLADAGETLGVAVLHAGTSRQGEDVVSSGGRVLGVVGTGESIAAARAAAYAALDKIHLADSHYRSDIAAKVNSA